MKVSRRILFGLAAGLGAAFGGAARPATAQTRQRAMTELERNKQVVRDYFDRCFNKGDLDFGKTIIVPDYNFHMPLPPGTPRGYEAWRAGVAMFRTAFPDCNWQVHQIAAEGDLVSVRTVWTGTHSAPFMGVPASGRKVVAANSDYYRMKDGKFVEHWDVPDYLAVLRQIGGKVDAGLAMYAGSTEP